MPLANFSRLSVGFAWLTPGIGRRVTCPGTRPLRSIACTMGPFWTMLYASPAEWVISMRTVTGRLAGSRFSGPMLPSYFFCTCILAKPGMKSATGWSSLSLPSSTSIIAAIPVIGLVIE